MKTAIVISTCDLYCDCWLPMIHSIRKYWPDCPFPIYFVSNFKNLDEVGIEFIKVGEHKGFGSNMKKALDLIDADNVILFLEDFFIGGIVNTEVINDHLKHCIEKSIDFLKIDSCDIMHHDDMRIGDSCYCLNPIDIRYSLNLAIAIWKKSTLQSLCVEGFSAWDFERKGIDHIRKNNLKINSETILSTDMDAMTIKKISGAGAVMKGRWTIEGKNFLIENGFNSLLAKRQIEGRFSRYLTSFYTPNSLLWLPFGLLLRIIQKFKINI
ncbi:hypothetical protein QUH73_10730 [Labilibaculum sp. K2S]|uniref:hypothetical protein n=1 Tax=Labilibaculum sp. K2S TaxID=3056386 RepID=UPI0025A318E8|nr:hypothetical protein [Labilibaculum sp. K2S]MDM8160289.1 hypothetical protein [Labilibaculum sp. K2S]